MSEENTGRASGSGDGKAWHERATGDRRKAWHERWAEVSPFARAAACVTLAERASRMASEMADFGEWAGSGGLDRRERHSAEVVKALNMLAGMCGALCHEADAECAALLGEPKDGGQ